MQADNIRTHLSHLPTYFVVILSKTRIQHKAIQQHTPFTTFKCINLQIKPSYYVIGKNLKWGTVVERIFSVSEE